MLMRPKQLSMHGRHCPGDVAVRMRKVLARPWVGVRVCHLLLLLLLLLLYKHFFYSLHLLIAAKSKFICAIIKLKREAVVRTLTLPPRVHNFCPQTSVNGLPSTFRSSRHLFIACACARMKT